jgi:hypothetical protein
MNFHPSKETHFPLFYNAFPSFVCFLFFTACPLSSRCASRGHAITWEAEKSTHGRASLASQRKTDLGKCRSCTCGTPGIDTGQIGKPLGENLAETLRIFTEKATNLHEQPKGFPDAGHVLERANVVTVDMRGYLLAKRAGGFKCVARKRQDESLLSDFDPLQTHAGRKTEQKSWLN